MTTGQTEFHFDIHSYIALQGQSAVTYDLGKACLSQKLHASLFWLENVSERY